MEVRRQLLGLSSLLLPCGVATQAARLHRKVLCTDVVSININIILVTNSSHALWYFLLLLLLRMTLSIYKPSGFWFWFFFCLSFLFLIPLHFLSPVLHKEDVYVLQCLSQKSPVRHIAATVYSFILYISNKSAGLVTGKHYIEEESILPPSLGVPEIVS